ncbi:MAG: PP2C family serine/threonine-protein phosphatase [Acidimicrobiia bacterium]
MGWRAIGASVRGASHARSDLPNQDALAWLPEDATGPVVVLAVADGHGSAKCFRSEVGARFAVEMAGRALDELLAVGRLGSFDQLTEVAVERLPHTVVRAWRTAVLSDLEERPFTDTELARLEELEGSEGVQEVGAFPALAYGSTVLVAAAGDEGVVLFQLGDGDILTVSGAGEVARPMPVDPRLAGNLTTSLAGATAHDDARVRSLALDGSDLSLVILSTDGYSNSFADDEGFLRVGPDLLDLIRSDGLDAVSSDLSGWLAEASALGSGDDVTVGLLVRSA